MYVDMEILLPHKSCILMDIMSVKHMMLYKALWFVTCSSMYIWSRPFSFLAKLETFYSGVIRSWSH